MYKSQNMLLLLMFFMLCSVWLVFLPWHSCYLEMKMKCVSSTLHITFTFPPLSVSLFIIVHILHSKLYNIYSWYSVIKYSLNNVPGLSVYRYFTTVHISGVLHEEAVDEYSSRKGQKLWPYLSLSSGATKTSQRYSVFQNLLLSRIFIYCKVVLWIKLWTSSFKIL